MLDPSRVKHTRQWTGYAPHDICQNHAVPGLMGCVGWALYVDLAKIISLSDGNLYLRDHRRKQADS